MQPQGRPSGGTHGGGTAAFSLNEVLALLHYVGFNGQNQANMAAVAMAESGGDPNAVHVDADGSHDRGLFQINDVAHPEVSDACAFDPVCSARQAAAIEKGSSLGAWSTWKSGAAEAWLGQVEQAQRSGKWKQYQTQFQSDNIGQAGNAANDAAATGTAAATGSKLFDCGSSSVSVFGIGTGLSTPDVGCYLIGAFQFTMYAVGGLILVGAGILLLMHKNPVKAGLAATAMTPLGRAAKLSKATTPAQQLGRERLSLQTAREQRLSRPRPVSTTTQLGLDREQRIAAREAREAPLRARRARAQASSEMSQGTLRRAQAFEIRQRAKQGGMYGMTGNRKVVSILGKDVEIPSFDVPGFEGDDPSVMRG
jgi:hypothetical protein